MFRRHFAGLLVVCVVGLGPLASARAEELPTIAWQDDLQLALQTARTNQRPMLIFFTMEGCHYCSKMKLETYQDQQLASDISATYNPVAVDEADAKALVAQLSIESYPATVVISPKLQVLDQIIGYVPADQLRARLATLQAGSER